MHICQLLKQICWICCILIPTASKRSNIVVQLRGDALKLVDVACNLRINFSVKISELVSVGMSVVDTVEKTMSLVDVGLGCISKLTVSLVPLCKVCRHVFLN